VTNTALVTGGAGFIGGHLVRCLLERGERVRVLDVRAPGPALAGAEYVRGSVTDPDAVRRAIHCATHVYHLAALTDLWAADKGAFFTVNHGGTRAVLAAAAAEGVERVVHCSTATILGRAGASPGPYCRAKALAEGEAAAAAAGGLPVVIVTPTVPIGPGDPGLTPPSRMIRDFLEGAHAAYVDTTLNLVDARDVADGHVRAAERGVVGQRYVLGGESLRLAALLALLGELSGRAMPRRAIPSWLALAAAAASELWADHVGRRPPVAPLTGVRLARSAPVIDDRWSRAALGLSPRPVRESLADAIDDLARRGLLSRAR
jgi:dihydroflavonol-4-reductase